MSTNNKDLNLLNRVLSSTAYHSTHSLFYDISSLFLWLELWVALATVFFPVLTLSWLTNQEDVSTGKKCNHKTLTSKCFVVTLFLKALYCLFSPIHPLSASFVANFDKIVGADPGISKRGGGRPARGAWISLC